MPNNGELKEQKIYNELAGQWFAGRGAAKKNRGTSFGSPYNGSSFMEFISAPCIP